MLKDLCGLKFDRSIEARRALAAWRHAQELTQTEAGERVGIGRTNFGKIETGSRAPTDGQKQLIEKHCGIAEEVWDGGE